MRRTDQASALALAAAAFGAALWYRRSRPPATNWYGRVVLITGGSRGLGLALARELADRDAVVWIASRDAESVERAVHDLRSRGGRSYGVVLDVTDPQAVIRVVHDVAATHQRLDCVISNAGVITAMPFVNAEVADFAQSLDTHFWGPLHVIRAALPWLRRAQPGHIVNVSSIGGRVGVPHLAPYCAGKWALTGLSEALHAELAGEDVRVTTVTPGLMRTGSTGRVKVRGQREREARWFAALTATSLTSMGAARAARQIVNAVSAGRATVTPGWQARALQLSSTLLPEVTASMQAVVTTRLLPGAAAAPTDAREIRELDLGWAGALLPGRVAGEFNQS